MTLNASEYSWAPCQDSLLWFRLGPPSFECSDPWRNLVLTVVVFGSSGLQLKPRGVSSRFWLALSVSHVHPHRFGEQCILSKLMRCEQGLQSWRAFSLGLQTTQIKCCLCLWSPIELLHFACWFTVCRPLRLVRYSAGLAGLTPTVFAAPALRSPTGFKHWRGFKDQ